MGWPRLASALLYLPTSSLNSRAVSLPRPPRAKRGSSSIADSLTSFEFRRKTYSEGEVDAIDLVPLQPLLPSRVSRSNSPSELPQSEEVILDHATPLPSPPASVHESPPSPSMIKNAVAFFERKASGYLATQLPASETTSFTISASMTPSPTYTKASEAERKLEKSVSEAEWPKSDSEDSMAPLFSMLNEPPANLISEAGDQQRLTPIHHEPSCQPTSSNINMLSPTWMNPPRSGRSSEQKSESTSSLRTLDTNRNVMEDEPSDLKPVVKTHLHSRMSRSGHSRSWAIPEKDLGETQFETRRTLFRRPFILSRRSQSRTLTEIDSNYVVALPCFMASRDDFANHRAVQGLPIVASDTSMAAFIDGSNSPKPSSSVAVKGQDSETASTHTLEDGSVTVQSRPVLPRSPRPVSARSGLPLSSRSFNKARATSAVSYFTRSPGMHISDMPPRQLMQIDEKTAFPSPQLPSPGSKLSSPGVCSPSYAEALSYAWDVPRTGSPASIGSSSRRHSMAGIPVKIDSAAHFPRSVSPSWDLRPQSSSAIIVDAPLSPLPLEPSYMHRVPVSVNPAAQLPRSGSSPKDFVTAVAEAPKNKMPIEPTFSSCHSADLSDTPLYPMPIEPSFGRKRSNSKFEPNPDLQPISAVTQTTQKEVPQDDLPLPMTDGHRSTGAVYDPPVSSPHLDTPAPEKQGKLEKDTKKENKQPKKLKKKKPHEKRHKLVRYSRHFLLRKKVLNFLLGRQLGGAVADGLKALTCMPVGTESLDLAVVAVPGGVASPLHAGAVFTLAVVVGRKEMDEEEKLGRLHVVESGSCAALTAPDVSDSEQGHRRRSRHLSMDDLSSAIRHVDYGSAQKGRVMIE